MSGERSRDAASAPEPEAVELETEAQRNLRLLQERLGAPQPRAPLPGQPPLFEPEEPDGGGGDDATSNASAASTPGQPEGAG